MPAGQDTQTALPTLSLLMPCDNRFGMPPASGATTARPQAIASSTTLPIVSISDGVNKGVGRGVRRGQLSRPVVAMSASLSAVAGDGRGAGCRVLGLHDHGGHPHVRVALASRRSQRARVPEPCARLRGRLVAPECYLRLGPVAGGNSVDVPLFQRGRLVQYCPRSRPSVWVKAERWLERACVNRHLQPSGLSMSIWSRAASSSGKRACQEASRSPTPSMSRRCVRSLSRNRVEYDEGGRGDRNFHL
jgi:hypothetical protein